MAPAELIKGNCPYLNHTPKFLRWGQEESPGPPTVTLLIPLSVSGCCTGKTISPMEEGDSYVLTGNHYRKQWFSEYNGFHHFCTLNFTKNHHIRRPNFIKIYLKFKRIHSPENVHQWSPFRFKKANWPVSQTSLAPSFCNVTNVSGIIQLLRGPRWWKQHFPTERQ